MLIFISISCVNASENETILSNDVDDLTAISADDNVTGIGADDDDVLTAGAAGTFTELYNLISSGNKISLEKDYAAKSGDGFIYINKSLELDGKGHTIDAGGVTTVFRTPADTDANITFKNLIIKNAFIKRGWGGAVYISSDSNVNFVIKNCTFINNKADFGAGAIEFTPKHGTLEISDSTFIGNNALKGTGGAIRDAAQKTKIINSKFEGNIANGGDGGAVYISTDSNADGVIIDNCIFNKNYVKRDEAGFNGGAVRAKTAPLKITNSNFTDNHVTGRYEGSQKSIFGDMDGGAIESEGRLELGGCYFKDNSAYDCGGAVAANTLVWLDKPCVFIHNHVETWNDVVANKGGAVFAHTFENTAKGQIFINNSGYYGGAVYLCDKGNVKFESCYFEGNTALTSTSKHGSGAAIYADSSGSKLSLVSNIFVNNKATSDSAVFNCGDYVSYTGNWWGTNSPNFSHEQYLVEWHRMKSNSIYTDSGYLQAVLRSDKTDLYGESAHLTLQIIDSKGKDFTGKLTNLDATFSAANGGVFTNKQIHDNKITITFTPKTATDKVTAKINNQILTLSFNQTGNFTKLQQEINAAKGVLNLTHDYTYTVGVDTMYEGIVINKPIVINGNGHFINALEKSRIFLIKSDNVTINNVTFDRGFFSMAGGITIEGSNVKILNSKFTNNGAGQYGGAIFARSGNNLQITGCQFINNKNSNEGGGAILVDTPNTRIEKSIFLNNTGIQGGALDLRRNNVIIDECEFRNNVAINENRNGGGAINNNANNVTIKNSLFLNNKARSTGIQGVSKDNSLVLTLTGKENYINAINSNTFITFSKVKYWDGAVTTSNNPVRSMNECGQNITLEIFNSENKAVKKIIVTTNKNGQAIFNYDSLPMGNYTFTATHPDDSYYTACSYSGKFNVTRTPGTYPSEVKINIENKSEFKHGNCNISFEVTNKTIVEVVITNSDYSQILYDNETTLNYVMVDLPASDEYYNIFVFNHGNSTYDPSSAEKSFKILKENSKVSINPVGDVKYSDPVNVAFTGDGTSYNVTVYDEDDSIVFTQITDKNSVKISSALDVGKYNVTVINIGNENRTSSKASTNFNVVKKDNKITVTVQDATYGEGTTLTVYANADGKYTVYINSTEIPVDVNGGIGVKPLDLAAGSYKTNVKFDNPNYNNTIESYDFIIRKAQSNVVFSLVNVTHKQNTTVTLVDSFPAEYNITLYDSGNNIKFHDIINKTEFTIPALDVGEYNLTVINMGNENIAGSQYSDIFDVTTDNYVEIIVDDAEYDKELVIYVYADVDGYYTVDINGTELIIEVIDGFGFNNTLNLDAGDYYANVSFDDDEYNNIIENTAFSIYPAESKLFIEDTENVTYGNDININYYDDYNATFDVVIFDEKEDPVLKFTTNATSIKTSDLAAGNYKLMVTNKGNKNILGVSELQSFTVYKATPEMKVSAVDNEIIVELPKDATGNVTTIINGKELSYPVVDGLAIIPLYELKQGNYSFDVKYSGDKNYTADSGKVNVGLTKITPEMKVTANQKEINVVMSDDVTGNVSTTVNGKEISVPLSNGKATIPLGDLNPGNYTFNVKYTGNDKYYPRSEKTSVNIPKIDPNMTTSLGDNELIIELPDDATGNVTTNINGVDYSSPVVEGLAIIPLYDLEPGNYTLDLKYSGDDKYLPDDEKITVELYKDTPEMTVTAKDNVINVELPENATGNVTVTVNGKKYSAQVNKGKATITLTDLNPGKYTADVKYTGDDEYYPRSEKVDVTIPKINPEMKVHKNNDEIIVELPKDATGNVTIEVDGEKIVAPVENGKAEFSLDKLDSGDYNVSITYCGDDKYNPVTKKDNISINGIEMFADDVIKYFGGSQKLIVKLMNNDKTIPSKEIEITLNGVTYTRVTDEKGEVSLALNLDPGNYTALVESKDYGLSTLVDIEIKSTIESDDLVKVFRNATQFRALFLDGNGKAIANTNMEFNIHGVFYTRTTDANGWAELNINLEEGEYIITSINTVTGESKGNKITVISLIESSDLTKYYKNGTQFVVRARSDDGGWAKEGEEVLFNINGVFYVRITNETGHASLNINLEPGDYIITSKFRDCEQGNNISVLPVLSAEDLNMKYKDGSQFTAKLVDGQGKAYPNQNITFNVNGVLYTRTTDANGEAKLNINLMSGEYIITSSYNGLDIANKITISS